MGRPGAQACPMMLMRHARLCSFCRDVRAMGTECESDRRPSRASPGEAVSQGNTSMRGYLPGRVSDTTSRGPECPEGECAEGEEGPGLDSNPEATPFLLKRWELTVFSAAQLQRPHPHLILRAQSGAWETIRPLKNSY